MGKIKPQPGIMDIELYVGGASTVEGVRDVVKLSSNENPHGPGDAALEAYRRAGHGLHRYPSSDHWELRAAIAQAHGLDSERIVCGAGSDELLSYLCHGYAGPGDEVIYTEHGFSLYPNLALAAGATPVKVPERDRVVDVEEILKAAGARTRVVFVTNPGNPTGTTVPLSDLAHLAENLPGHVLLVLDGAYTEFWEGYDGGASLVEARDNVVMTRTFSKLYGLGGLRVGWAYGPGHVVDVLNRLRPPFNLSVTQLAVAKAALGDTKHVERCKAENARMRAWMANALREMELGVDDSQANFLLVRFADTRQAEGCDAHLQSKGLIVRRAAGYGFPEGLRITIGDEPACRRVVHAIREYLGQGE